MSGPNRHPMPDRLGDAIRELARAMAENGKTSMQLHVVTPEIRAIYELRLLRTVNRAGAGNVRRLPRASDHIIETEAFSPDPSLPPAQGGTPLPSPSGRRAGDEGSSRPMAEKRK